MDQPERDTKPLKVDPPTRTRNLLIANSNRRQVLPYLNHDQEEWDHIEDIFTIDMVDDCLREKNYIRQEYDSIYIMMGTNDIKHNKDKMRAAKQLVTVVKETRKQKPQTSIKILEILLFRNYSLQKKGTYST